MRYINEVDGLKVVLSLKDLNEIVDDLRILTMPPVLAGLERLDAPDWFVARQLAVPEMSLLHWKTGRANMTTDRQINLCKILEQGIEIYLNVLTGYENDGIDRPFYEIGVLKEHIRCAVKLLNLQRKIIAEDKTRKLHPDTPESCQEIPAHQDM